MRDVVFRFEKEKLPPVVALTTGALFCIFGVGIGYRLLEAVAF